MKNISLFVAGLLLVTGFAFQSCTGGTDAAPATGARVSGQISDAPNLQAFLDKVEFTNSNSVVSKAELDGNGKFEMLIPDGLSQGIYRLRIGAARTMMVLDGSENNIKINGDLATMKAGDVTVDGAPESTKVFKLMRDVQTKKATLEEAKAFAETTSNPLSAAMVAQALLGGDEKYLPTTKAVAAKLNQAMPNTSYANDFNQYAGSLAQQIAQRKSSAKVAVGQPAPDIKLESPDGKTYSLSDLKGKVVLLDFWASWCGPCRKANPHVVDMYDKYNKKGFEVFNVSMDGINPRMLPRLKTQKDIDAQLKSSKERWVQAIKKDNLKWKYHVSDLKHWNSAPAGVYGVRSIPRTFLIDRDGNIAVAGVKHQELETKIKSLL